MAKKVPTVRQIAWVSLIPHLSVMGILTFIAWLIHAKSAFLLGGITYLVLSFSLRRLIPRDHRKGIQATQKENFREAIDHFKASYAFFIGREWLDKYRYLTLLSSSRMSYREMALVNIAFCYGQLGESQQARQGFEKALKHFPESIMAKTGLRFFEGMESKQAEKAASTDGK